MTDTASVSQKTARRFRTWRLGLVSRTGTALFPTWRARSTGAAPPRADGPSPDTGDTDGGPAVAALPAALTGGMETALWRMRATVQDEPGTLAALARVLADRRVDILTLQTHPLADGTVDEFLLRVPVTVEMPLVAGDIAAAGGRNIWTERADAHDLVDIPTRMLGLATRTALDAAELPLALRQLLGRCTIRSRPAGSIGDEGEASPEADAALGAEAETDTVMRLRDPSGGTLIVERPHLPFTPTEFARAHALVQLDALLGPRLPQGQDVLTLSEGSEISVRRADTGDLAAARALHSRCSPQTLSRRYHGPVRDADRYLGHLLSPHFGRTLAARTSSGTVVALGHLLWDGDEAEVALLVEDAWQRRGVGGQLLRRLIETAADSGYRSVYAVTQSSNTAMVAAMRGLDLPLDYQIEEGTLVITVRLSSAVAAGNDIRPS